MDLSNIAGLIIISFVGLLGLTILVWIWMGKIPLYKLICEPNGDASMSRLQLLIFTFVISLSFFLVTVGKNPPSFPNPIPPEVLTLLGISASSYLVSKGIQFSSPSGSQQAQLSVNPGTLAAPTAGAPIPQQVLTASIPNVAQGSAVPPVTWALDSPSHGTLTVQSPNSVLYAPATGIAPGVTVTIRAQAAGYSDGIAVVTY